MLLIAGPLMKAFVGTVAPDDPGVTPIWFFILAVVCALLAGAVHVAIFCMESLWWTTPAVRARFRQSEEHAQVTRLLAFNQGFYNLFLARAQAGACGLKLAWARLSALQTSASAFNHLEFRPAIETRSGSGSGGGGQSNHLGFS